ncbi:hypothetical protein AB0N06_31485 [Streptomyces sp. NPDC051020]|uniref:hypothetical protein n=1 Tax=Streptomyces sp. NPDC051020 TaxID=3155409 RepID=UPI003416B10F
MAGIAKLHELLARHGGEDLDPGEVLVGIETNHGSCVDTPSVCAQDWRMWRHHRSRIRNAQNSHVARVMNGFYRHRLPNSPEGVARSYVEYLFDPTRGGLYRGRERRITKSPYSVLLATEDPYYSLARLTKRGALVTDTLLLTHGAGMPYQEVGRYSSFELNTDASGSTYGPEAIDSSIRSNYAYGINAPGLNNIGRFLIDSEPLARSGIVWYLPRYSSTEQEGTHFLRGSGAVTTAPGQPRTGADFLIRDGRAVSESEATPLKSRYVRFITEVNIPVIEGVSLADFSRITMGEFDGYRLLRDHIQGRIAELDDAMAANEVDREILKIGHEVKAGIGEAQAQITKAKRKGALTGSAALVSVTGTLFAVYAPMIRDALQVVGLGAGAGSVWVFLQHWSEKGPRASVENKWYYMWVLSRAAERVCPGTSVRAERPAYSRPQRQLSTRAKGSWRGTAVRGQHA